ncbi:hypothetical protein Pcinc_022658 [Petrolisthes cinctipes]|uniref:Large ribosomal subunit protein uL10m n=1 Tax=Petrolisthes cinctipes TaxID=88211 RepID=A0AAE1FFV7_PETCI|nr:hypothetical protein Pcinc_023082 [Petrolisthes cinctipes]KAK3872252.1 hypothetical protein Pcinc_022658 [Petrolisthes cinctipes]
MSLSLSGHLLRGVKTPLVQTVRHRTPNLRKPAIPHWSRAVVLKLTIPTYREPNEGKHPIDLCDKKLKAAQKQIKVENPFETIVAKEIYEQICGAKLVAIFHGLPMTQARLFAARVQLYKMGLTYVYHNTNMMRIAVSGTRHEAMLKLYQKDTLMFVGDNPDVAKLLKLEKKISGMVLLGAVVDNRLMSLADLKQYAALPSLGVMQAQLVHTLGSTAQRISQNLVAHQMELTSSLTRHIEDKANEKED